MLRNYWNRFSGIMHHSTHLGLKRCRFGFYCDWTNISGPNWSKIIKNRDWHAHAPKLLSRFRLIMHHSTRLGLKRCLHGFYCDWTNISGLNWSKTIKNRDWLAHAPKLLNRFRWIMHHSRRLSLKRCCFGFYCDCTNVSGPNWSKTIQNSDWHAHAPKLLNRFRWIMHHSTRLGLKRCRFALYCDWALRRPTGG